MTGAPELLQEALIALDEAHALTRKARRCPTKLAQGILDRAAACRAASRYLAGLYHGVATA